MTLQLCDQVIAIFNNDDFKIAPCSFCNQFEDGELKELIRSETSDSEVASLIVNYPDFFVMNKNAEPEERYFFIVLLRCDGADDARITTILNYLPVEAILLVASVNNGKNIDAVGKWANDTDGDWVKLSEIVVHMAR